MQEKAKMTVGKRFYKPALFLFIAFFLLSLNACRTAGGVGVGWGGYAEPEAPPTHKPHHKHKVKKHGPPAHVPAHGYRAKHHYRYYPDAYVYYDTGRSVYFYMDNGAWRMSVSLPGFIRLGSAYVSLEMDIGEPYRHHYEHREQYPPKKWKHKKKKKKWE